MTHSLFAFGHQVNYQGIDREYYCMYFFLHLLQISKEFIYISSNLILKTHSLYYVQYIIYIDQNM